VRREPANANELLAILPGELRRNRTDWYATKAGALRVYVGNEVANQAYDFVPSEDRLIYHATEHESDRTICVHD